MICHLDQHRHRKLRLAASTALLYNLQHMTMWYMAVCSVMVLYFCTALCDSAMWCCALWRSIVWRCSVRLCTVWASAVWLQCHWRSSSQFSKNAWFMSNRSYILLNKTTHEEKVYSRNWSKFDLNQSTRIWDLSKEYTGGLFLGVPSSLGVPCSAACYGSSQMTGLASKTNLAY